MFGDRMDRINENLDILFIGFNPSLVSGEVGHHYASKSNRFWKILFQAGITDRLYKPDEDDILLSMGIGFTNIVSRPTKSADEITSDEYRIGRQILRNKITTYRPKIAFFVGKGVYLKYAQISKTHWGRQNKQIVEGVIDFVAPSSSGLVRMKMDDVVSIYKEVLSIMN